MKNLFKKIPMPLAIGAVAVLALIIILVCIFSGNKETTPDEVVIPSRGAVVLNIGGIVQIDYDISGNATIVKAMNGAGSIMLEQIDEYQGKPTTELVSQLLTVADSENYLRNLIVLMEVKGSQAPQSTGFLPALRDFILSKVGDGHAITMITVDDLTEDGYIKFEVARKLLQQYVNNDAVEISSTDEIRHDCYGMYAILGESATFYQVDCITGEVIESNPMEFYGGEEETFPSEPDDTMPDYFTDPDYLDPDMFYGNVEDDIPVVDEMPTEEATLPTEETVA